MPTPLSPAALAKARATLDVTTATAPDIARIRHDWAALKAAQGHAVQISSLPPLHLIAPPADQMPAAPAPTLAETNLRAHLRMLHYIRCLGRVPRSDLEGAA